VDDEVPACDMKCVQSVCASLGIEGIDVVCEDGTCGLERREIFLAAGVKSTTEAPPALCETCGEQLVLLRRGTDVPPRHCAEKMVLRRIPTPSSNPDPRYN
jgi:hypothetical protein